LRFGETKGILPTSEGLAFPVKPSSDESQISFPQVSYHRCQGTLKGAVHLRVIGCERTQKSRKLGKANATVWPGRLDSIDAGEEGEEESREKQQMKEFAGSENGEHCKWRRKRKISRNSRGAKPEVLPMLHYGQTLDTVRGRSTYLLLPDARHTVLIDSTSLYPR